MTNSFRSLSLTSPRRGMLALAGVGLLGALALIGTPKPAAAATVGDTIGIDATVVATCTVAVTPLAFGSYTGLVATATATVTPTCTNTTPYVIALDAGLGTNATVTARSMTVAGASLNYVLTTDAAHSINWGGPDVAGGAVAQTATTTPIQTTIFGQIAAGQFVAPGVYADTITATVTY